MINRIKLQDGKLYETVDGERFRVTWDSKKSCFVCPRASSIHWGYDGIPMNSGMLNALVREIPEMRWVSISEEDITSGMIVMEERNQWFQQVTRDEAQRMAPNYKPPEQVLPKDEQTTAKVERIKMGGKDFWRLSLPTGKVMLIED